MASLKDLVKSALDKKQGVKSDDGHDAVAKVDAGSKGKNKSAPVGSNKPPTRSAGRGR